MCLHFVQSMHGFLLFVEFTAQSKEPHTGRHSIGFLCSQPAAQSVDCASVHPQSADLCRSPQHLLQNVDIMLFLLAIL